MNIVAFAATAFFAIASTVAQAQHQHEHPAKPETTARQQTPWGIAGDAKAAKRTVTISMTDNMRFTPDRVEVKQGETLKFVVKNDGKLLHEMVIGNKKSLDEHAAAMQQGQGHAAMGHDEAAMVHVKPGAAGQLVWHFNKAGDFDFACLVPGHYAAGMTGKIRVLAAR